MLAKLATNIMSRGYTTPGTSASQVVSLNITNLLVLILLKALIFAAGSIGAGAFKGGHSRSASDDQIITDEEFLMYLSYLTGSPGDNGCLQNIACQKPEEAKRYLLAGDVILKTARTMSVKPDESYFYVLQELEEAIRYGMRNGDCNRYVCGAKNQIGT